MVVVAVGPPRLEPGDPVAHLDARDQAERLELLERAVDGRGADVAATPAERALELLGARRAGLFGEHLDHRGARAAAVTARFAQAARGVFGPAVARAAHAVRW